MRTERNRSPYQMFISGMLANDSRRQLFLEANIEPRHFGVDEDGGFAAPGEESQVICDPPRLSFILNDSQQEQLARCHASLQFQNDFGISEYSETLSIGTFNTFHDILAVILMLCLYYYDVSTEICK